MIRKSPADRISGALMFEGSDKSVPNVSTPTTTKFPHPLSLGISEHLKERSHLAH